MTAQTFRARYLSDSVVTASPARLLLMLYDRLVLDITAAEQAIAGTDHDTARERIYHAQEIVIELRGSLVVSAWSGGPGLASLYSHLLTELVQAGVERSTARLEHVRGCAEQLRDAWRDAAAQLAAPPA
jgi:flagellar protein FliS